MEGHEKIARSRLTVTEKRKRDRMDGALAYSGIYVCTASNDVINATLRPDTLCDMQLW